MRTCRRGDGGKKRMKNETSENKREGEQATMSHCWDADA